MTIKMGCYSSKVTTVRLPQTQFADSYQPPANTEVVNIQMACFTDMWSAMNLNDWTKKAKNAQLSETDTMLFKDRLHAYMKLHVCMEKHVVIQNKDRTWVFNVEYSESHFQNYRILTF